MCSSTLSNKAKTAAAMDDTLAAERSTTHGYLADQPPQRRGDKTSVALEQTKEHLSIEEENVGVEEFPEDQQVRKHLVMTCWLSHRYCHPIIQIIALQDAADPQRHKHARYTLILPIVHLFLMYM